MEASKWLEQIRDILGNQIKKKSVVMKVLNENFVENTELKMSKKVLSHCIRMGKFY